MRASSMALTYWSACELQPCAYEPARCARARSPSAVWLFVLALTVLVRCLKVVMSSSSVVCGSGMMMLEGRMFCHCHDR